MAFVTLLKFACAAGSIYLTKELGLWNGEVEDQQLEIRPTFFDQTENKNCEKCECEECKKFAELNVKSTWRKELKVALKRTYESLCDIPSHWSGFSSIIQDNIMSFFSSDD